MHAAPELQLEIAALRGPYHEGGVVEVGGDQERGGPAGRLPPDEEVPRPVPPPLQAPGASGQPAVEELLDPVLLPRRGGQGGQFQQEGFRVVAFRAHGPILPRGILKPWETPASRPAKITK